MVAAVPDEDGLISGLSEDQLVTVDEIDTLIKEEIKKVVGESAFMHTKVNQWTSNAVEGCLKRLAALNKPFKFVCTVNFVQKAGAGMHTASTALWDSKVDGKHTVQWENNTIQCITTVYWLAI